MLEDKRTLTEIIIAEDEVIEREYLHKILDDADEGFRVFAAVENGLKLLNAYRMYHCDAIILDIRMPVMNGLEVTKKIRETDQDVIIVLNTAYADFKYAKEAIDLGVNALLLKPTSKDVIFSKLHKLTQSRWQNQAAATSSQEKECVPIESLNSFYHSLTAHDLSKIKKEGSLIFSYIQNLPFSTSNKLFLHSVFYVLLYKAIRNPVFFEYYDMFYNNAYGANAIEGLDFYSIKKNLILLFRKLFFCIDELIRKNSCLAEEVDKFILANYNEEILLKDLEERFYLSGAYISTKYRTDKGLTIAQRQNNLRIEEACKLLLNSDMSVQDIANKVGFSNTSYFFRCFKKIMQTTPHKYRRAGIKNEY